MPNLQLSEEIFHKNPFLKASLKDKSSAKKEKRSKKEEEMDVIN